MFERPHHRRLESILHALNADLLEETECFFGGGTAIVLLLGEYRESVDIDLLCSSREGYRVLRNTVSHDGLGALLHGPTRYLREVRADLYGIRTFIEVDGHPVKIEIVSEGRIALHGARNPTFGVPTLTREDMFAEKLLANADRGSDRSLFSRDIVDLAMMIAHWGTIPDDSWRKTREAYGESVDRAYTAAISLVCDRPYLLSCLGKMNMDEGLGERIQSVFACTPETGSRQHP